MSHAKRRIAPAVMAVAVGIGVYAATARADDASTQQMQQKIEQLESKVQSLESKETTNQADIAAAIQQVMADANKNSQLLDSSNTGTGYDPATGFHIGSEDGNFYFHPFALVQFDGVYNYRGGTAGAPPGALTGPSADNPKTGTNQQDGFEIRRLKFGADGHIYTPNLGYFIQIDTDRSGGGMSLDDAYGTYQLNDQMRLKGGQFKDIAWHESNVDDANQLGSEESLVNALIGGTEGGSTGAFGANQARVQGVSFEYKTGPLRAEVAIHDGYASQNTPFYDQPAPAEIGGAGQGVNWGASARVEYKVLGDDTAWDEYTRFSAYGDKSDMAIIGGGLDYTEAGDDHVLFWTADAQYDNAAGLSAYAAFLGQYVRVPSGAAVGTPTTADSYGFLAQAGYLVTPQWEPFVRYDFTHLDDGVFNDIGLAVHNVHELTAGVNYYLYGHNAKLTLDANYLPTGCPVDADGLGYFAQTGNHPEWAVVAQFQLKI